MEIEPHFLVTHNVIDVWRYNENVVVPVFLHVTYAKPANFPAHCVDEII